MNITIIGPERLGAWQEYIDHHLDADPFSHAGWYRVLEKCFTVEPLYFVAEEAERITGVLPAYKTRSAVMGAHIAAMEGGAIADSGEVARALEDAAEIERDKSGTGYFLLRKGDRDGGCKIRMVRTVVDLQQGAGSVWDAISSNTRRKIRKAEKNGYSIEQDDGAVDRFYEIYAGNVRDLGTPVMGQCFMRAVADHLPDQMRLLTVSRGGRMVGGMMAFVNKGKWSSSYVAMERRELGGYPTYLLYWRAIEEASGGGAARLDLGRSAPEEGTHKFKRQWAGEDHYYDHIYLYADGADKRAARTASAARGGKTMKQRLWSRMPLFAANMIGPMIRRSLPFL